jgi:glutamate synthase domain-containing protein 2
LRFSYFADIFTFSKTNKGDKMKKTVNSVISVLHKAFIKLYSKDELKILESYNSDQLQGVISTCYANITRVTTETEQNEDWLKANDLEERAKEIKKPLKDALKEATDRQQVKLQLALKLLNNQGKVDLGIIEVDDQ